MQSNLSMEARTGCIISLKRRSNFLQGLKPQFLCGFRGTAKAVPFQSRVHATIPRTAGVFSGRGRLGSLARCCLSMLAVLAIGIPQFALAQEPCKIDKAERDAAKKAGHARPVESELIFEDQGSFGNYQIFAQGEDSKLFSAGAEYERHSWGCLMKAQVYYVAEFLPFVLLNEPANLNFYGVTRSTAKQLVPGIGITPIGFRMLWRDGRAIQPYLMAKAGFLVFTQKAESPNASYENISLRSEIGVQIRMTRRVDLRLGMGDYHFSNVFVVPSNPGLDVMSYMGGIAFRLKE